MKSEPYPAHHPHNTRILCLILFIMPFALSACGFSIIPETITLSEEPPTTLTWQTYGDGGEGLIGSILSIRARRAQTVEVDVESGPQIDESGTEIFQEFSLRYSQEPVPPQ